MILETINHIKPGVHKVVKHALKVLQHILKILKVRLTISLIIGVIVLK